MKKSSSKRWLKEHFSDIYVKRARQEGFRARSVYKLMEIDKRYQIIKSGMIVVDLGASPGGWSGYVAQKIGQKGKAFALDILDMQPIQGVKFIQGDFTKDEVLQCLCGYLCDQKVDVVLSDMAPNISGVKDADQMRMMNLAYCALNFSRMVLKSSGTLVIKMFHGIGFEDFIRFIRKYFSEVKVIKPEASRSRSSEVFVVARNLV